MSDSPWPSNPPVNANPVRRSTSWLRAPLWALTLPLSLVLGGCSLYHKPYPAADVDNELYRLRVVQADDFGSFWDYRQAQHVLDGVKTYAARTNTIVLVFIHGWHHNAQAEDSNLCKFKETLEVLGRELRQDANNQARQQLTGDPGLELIGIYVGWRGRSLPGKLDYLTSWPRKSAAERVGDGDVSEFLARLQKSYLRFNSPNRADEEGKSTFMGLVTLGHSFGGQVLLKSVSDVLEQQLIEVTDRLAESLPPKAALTEAEPPRPVEGLGDLVVLLNPAAEAYQLARIDGLYRQFGHFPSTQTPQLVVFSADNDGARQTLFPLARAITRPFRPGFRDKRQGALFGTAIGEYRDQQTHTLRKVVDQHDSLSMKDYRGTPPPILAWDFTDTTVFGNVAMAPLPDTPRIKNSPVAVVYTHDGLIDGHNGIFADDFRDFLVLYVAYIEGKRMMLNALARQADKSKASGN